jgi:hypothetical protein
LVSLEHVCFTVSIFLVSFALFHHQLLAMYPQIEMNDHLLARLVCIYDQKGANKSFDPIPWRSWLDRVVPQALVFASSTTWERHCEPPCGLYMVLLTYMSK